MPAHTDDAELIGRFVQNRTSELRDRIVLNFVPLVHFVLGRMGISREIGADYEDMVSQGLLGLIDAVDRYDPGFGTQFSSYAVLRIRGKILDYMRSMDWMSRGARRRTRLVQKAVTDLWQTTQREPSDEELAAYLLIEVSKVQQALMDASRVLVSMDSVLDSDDEEEGSYHETLADERQSDPSDIVDENELKERLVNALKKISEREQLVLSLYYHEELTFKEIGQVLNVSESGSVSCIPVPSSPLKAMLSKESE